MPLNDPAKAVRVQGQSGLGQESADEGGPVLDALEPVLDDRGELVHVAGGEVAQAVLHVRPDTLTPPPRSRAAVQRRPQPGQLRSAQPDTAPPGPLDASAASPPARQRRRHTYAEFDETRSRRATSGGVTPSANHSAACNRTSSRLTRPAADRPPPSGYLITPQ